SILAREYAVAMQEYLTGGEAGLRRAYEAGRRALAEGMGVLDILAAQQAPMISALKSQVLEQDKELALERALNCLAESLSPFEMVLRGAQEANDRLQQSLSSVQRVEEQLSRQNETLIATHREVTAGCGRYTAMTVFAAG